MAIELHNQGSLVVLRVFLQALFAKQYCLVPGDATNDMIFSVGGLCSSFGSSMGWHKANDQTHTPPLHLLTPPKPPRSVEASTFIVPIHNITTPVNSNKILKGCMLWALSNPSIHQISRLLLLQYQAARLFLSLLMTLPSFLDVIWLLPTHSSS